MVYHIIFELIKETRLVRIVSQHASMRICDKVLMFLQLTALSVLVSCGSTRDRRQASDLNAGNWDSCKEGSVPPPTRVNTTVQVAALRAELARKGIHAYLVPNEDEHQSEYPSQYDKRRGYISGFSGSAGYVVVTANKAALWTDGRYFLEAEDTLDCNWILMRSGEPGVPTMLEWLKTELSNGNRFGANPLLIGSATWKSYESELAKPGISMHQELEDLVDRIWTSGRPPQPDSTLNALPMNFAGRSWQDKVSDVRGEMTKKEVDMLVVTGLDETAWLFNLRGSDIAYNPFFLSYAIVDNSSVSLYLLSHTRKLTEDHTDPETSVTVAEHLNTNPDGTCTGKDGLCVQVKPYNSTNVVNEVRTRSQEANIKKVWLGFTCNYAIYSAVNESKIYQDNTPVATIKTNKNPVEVEGMKNSHIRDAVALIEFLAKLEREVKEGKSWTELSASDDLQTYREKQDYNRGLSFNTISGSGSNGAIIHYSVTNVTSAKINTSSVYLLDSGGQYLDGTTDVTRTLHFGTPTAYEKECYTRVLMGHINLFQAKWPKGLYGREIDAFARGPLWDVGLVYRHGTGHGIGMFLSVHEGPGRISLSHGTFSRDNILAENQFFSDEPGYYEDGKFGIRLENIVMVINATTKYTFPGTQFLTFDHVTLVPYEPNLTNLDMLSDKQIDYLNDYNRRIREKVLPELKSREAEDWLKRKTEHIEKAKTTSGSGTVQKLLPSLLVLFAVLSPLTI